MRHLSHTRVTGNGQPRQWLYVMHGIYGSGRNWGSVARRLVDARPDWGVMLTDLRLHGGSLGMPPPHTVEQCAHDLEALQDHLGIPATATLGHSFGGKVALMHADAHPDQLSQVWVVDSTLRVGEPSGTPWAVLGIVDSLPKDFASRDELANAMVAHGYSPAVGQWLAMNLERAGDRFRWKLDWAGVEELLRDYFRTDAWGVVENPPGHVILEIVKAAESNAIDADAIARLREAETKTGRVHLHEVAGGHWLNIDNPDSILALLTERLP